MVTVYYVLTIRWQYVDSMSLPVCPCLWRLWFSRIMIWKFNGAAAGAVQLASKTQRKKKRIGPHLPRRARWPWFRLLRLLRWLCMLVDTWNMLKSEADLICCDSAWIFLFCGRHQTPKLWFLPLWKGLFQAITSIMTGEQIVIYLT